MKKFNIIERIKTPLQVRAAPNPTVLDMRYRPLLLSFHFDETTGFIYAVEDGRGIPSQEDFELLIKEWGRFYQQVTLQEIERANQELNAPYEPSAPLPIKQPPTNGFVYLLKAPDGLYKIGKAKEVSKRLEGLKLPFEVETLHIIPSNNYTRAEKFFHDAFKSQRVRGEWFVLSVSDVEWIRNHDRKDF